MGMCVTYWTATGAVCWLRRQNRAPGSISWSFFILYRQVSRKGTQVTGTHTMGRKGPILATGPHHAAYSVAIPL